MPRVIGIDPGPVSIDLCGLEDGTVFLDRSFPTAAALADPGAFVALLTDAGPLDLIAGPSGYGLPLVRAREATEEDLRLAFLAAEGEADGIGGLRALARALAGSGLPVVLTPGVIHLTSVPEHRKVNRVDMGTADKVCVAALAIAERAVRTTRPLDEVSLVLLELGGAFTAVIAVARGKIVDGAGGSAGPLGSCGGGALDGGVACVAGAGSKAMLFTGGAASVAGWDAAAVVAPERFARPAAPRERVAWDAFVESAVKFATAIALSVPSPREFVLSGRLTQVEAVQQAIRQRLGVVAPTHSLDGFASVAKQGAPGAALVADGLAGGRHRAPVEAMAIRTPPRAGRPGAGPRPRGGSARGARGRAGDPRGLGGGGAGGGRRVPRLRFAPPPAGAAWLVKPLRSGGGAGVVPWRRGARLPRGCYLQQRVAGVTGSIVFAADGQRAVPLGLSRILAGERRFGADGFRYCGSVLGAAGDPQFPDDTRLLERAARLAQAVTAAWGLVGVNGVDFVARRGVPFAIEVNPRYTASMELVERAYGLSIFEIHARACAGALPAFDLASARRRAPGAVGKAILHARRPSAMGEARAWLADPDVRDVSPPGTRFAPRDPVCTVFARGADAAACDAALERRAAALYRDIERSEARIA